MKKRFDHTGSSFDGFLEEEGIREKVEAVALKRVIAWQLEQAMRQQKTKLEMARALGTSRSQLDRLLDPKNAAVSLASIARAAHVVGKRVDIRLTDIQGVPGVSTVAGKRFSVAARKPITERRATAATAKPRLRAKMAARKK
jgi:antitoxin HicB